MIKRKRIFLAKQIKKTKKIIIIIKYVCISAENFPISTSKIKDI